MFKKINQTLITKYPLIWNLKLIWILFAAISLNLIAFINGFLYFNQKSQLQESQLFRGFLDQGIIIYHVLVAIIILIIWLYFYIKNNRFKSFFPTSRNYLFKEFLAVFLIFFLFSYLPNSFKSGVKLRVANYISNDQFEKDIDIINRAQPFTLQYNFGYSNYSRNLPVPVFDSLVSEKETKTLYFQNKKEYEKMNKRSYNPFLTPYFRNDEFEQLLKNHFDDRKSYQSISFSTSYVPLNRVKKTDGYLPDIQETMLAEQSATDNVTMAAESIVSSNNNDEPEVYYNLSSLYNYSDLAFQNVKDSTLNHKYYDEQLIALLQKNDRKAIESLLNNYTDLLNNNEIGYQFKHKKWIDYLPHYPYYFIDTNLNYLEDKQAPNNKLKDYINQSSLNQVYTNIYEAKYESSWLEGIQYCLMLALSFTMLIITFRFSSFKVWLIALVGAGILMILGSALGMGIGSIFYEQSNFISYSILFLFYIAFIVLMSYGLRTKKYKVLTGVCLNWFVATNIFIGIVLISFYTEIRNEMLYNGQDGDLYDFRNTNAELQMLQKMAEIFFYVNPFLYIISFYFIINLYKKWQAMPEE